MKPSARVFVFGALALTPLGGILLMKEGWNDPVSASGPRIVSEEGFPVRLALADGSELVIPAAPQKIVPANAGAADFVTLLVGPERVAALPAASFDYSRLAEDPDAWSQLPRFTGYHAETILDFGADLVLTHGWQSLETSAILQESGIPVVVCPLPESWEDVRATLELIGRIVGEDTRAEAIATALDERIERLRERAAARAPLRAVSYSNLGGTGGWAAGRGSTADILFGLTGLTNATEPFDMDGHEPVTAEMLLTMDPDVILVGAANDGEGMAPTEEFLRTDATLSALAAVRENRIIALPQRLFTTSSLELVTGAEVLSDAIDALERD